MQPYYQDDSVTLYHGDCREVLPQIPDASVRMIFTDPPYGHNNHAGDLNSRLNKKRGVTNKPIANDDPEGMREVVSSMLTHAVRVLCCCCCCCCCGGGGPRPTFAWLAQRMDTEGLQFFHSLIWDKKNPGLGWRYRRRHEMMMVAHKAGEKLSWSGEVKAFSNIISVSAPHCSKRTHPNEKPESLIELMVKAHTSPGEIMLDPFAGTGSSLLVTAALGRKAVGIELDEQYCEKTVQRRLEQISRL